MPTSEQIRECKAKLEESRRNLTEEMEHLRESSAALDEGQGASDLADASQAQYDKQFVGRLSETDKRLLDRVNAALARINAKDYGICVDCGEEIPFRRLLAVPYGERCVACQEIAERDAKNRSSGPSNEPAGFDD